MFCNFWGSLWRNRPATYDLPNLGKSCSKRVKYCRSHSGNFLMRWQSVTLEFRSGIYENSSIADALRVFLRIIPSVSSRYFYLARCFCSASTHITCFRTSVWPSSSIIMQLKGPRDLWVRWCHTLSFKLHVIPCLLIAHLPNFHQKLNVSVWRQVVHPWVTEYLAEFRLVLINKWYLWNLNFPRQCNLMMKMMSHSRYWDLWKHFKCQFVVFF